MRYLNKGERLTKKELIEISLNYTISRHAKERLQERKMRESHIARCIRESKLAYFNTDGSINVAVDDTHYFVFIYNPANGRFNMVTYKEPSHNDLTICDKWELAKKGVRR